MIEKTIKLYTFNELSAKVQKQLITKEKNKEYNIEYDIFAEDYLYERQLQLNKIADNIKIMYAGFFSQGDGACITGENFNLKKVLRQFLPAFCKHNKISQKRLNIILNHVNFSLKHNNYNYYHEFSVHYDYDMIDRYSNCISGKLYNIIDKLGRLLECWQRTIAARYYKNLEKMYCYYQSDEFITDMLIENKYLYFSDGTLYTDLME